MNPDYGHIFVPVFK